MPCAQIVAKDMSATQEAIDALFASGVHDADGHAQSAPWPGSVASARRAPNIRRILSLSVPVNATLAERDMSVESILTLTVGSIIEFEKLFDAELSLRVGNREIGAGHAVKVAENFGLRLTRIGSIEERIDAMGGY